MAPTVLVKDLLWRCSVMLGDTSPQFQRFAERDMVQALNDGIVATASYVPLAGARVDAIKLAAGSRQVIESIPQANVLPGDGITLTQPLRVFALMSLTRNMGADGLTPGPAITLADRDLLDAFDPNWMTTPGAEVEHYVYDPMTPGVFWTVPALAAPRWVEARLHACPPLVPNNATVDADGKHMAGAYGNAQSSTQTITISDQWATDLMNYVLARMWMRDGKFREPVKAQAAVQLYVNSINKQAEAITGVNPNLKALPGGGS